MRLMFHLCSTRILRRTAIFTPSLPTYLPTGEVYLSFFRCKHVLMIVRIVRVAFANNLDPNVSGLPTWNEYGSSKQSLQIEAGATEMIADNFRQAGIE